MLHGPRLRQAAGPRLAFVGQRIVLGGLAWWMAACASMSGDRLPPTRTIDSAGDLLRSLQAAGADPDVTQGALLPEVGGSGSVLTLGGEEVQVYEFASQPEREAFTGRISPDGSQLDGRPLSWQGEPHLWATGRVLVAYVGTDGGLIMLLNGLMGDQLTSAGPGSDEPYPPAVPAAMQALAQELGGSPQDIAVVRYEQAVWPDTCLGLPRPGEQCAEVETPGWSVTLAVGGVEYELHTDAFGAQVRRR